jgi:hypothetical protein
MKKRPHQSAGRRSRAITCTRRVNNAIAGLEFFLSGPGFPGIAADLPKRAELYDRTALHVSDRV